MLIHPSEAERQREHGDHEHRDREHSENQPAAHRLIG
jgi:hypothetical protein